MIILQDYMLVLHINIVIFCGHSQEQKYQYFFYNSQGYDSHFIIDEISRFTKIDEI